VSRRRRPGIRVVVAAGLVVAVAVAVLAGLYASGSPDGLNRVASDHGLTGAQKPHQLDGSPLAGYQADGLGGALSGGVAGLVGIGVTFVLAAGATWLVRRRRPPAGANTAMSRPGGRPDDRAAGGSESTDQAEAAPPRAGADGPAERAG
jgi:cobalt/nickel transport protein